MSDVAEYELGEVGRPEPAAPPRARRPWRRVAVALAALTVAALVVLLDAPARSALAQVPTHGSLAGDEAVVSALEERAADVVTTDDGRRWHGDWRPAADVVLAADVAGSRVALVEVTQRSGLSLRRHQVWFAGPVGADVADLDRAASQAAAGTATAVLPRGGVDGGTLVVVAGTSGTQVTADGGTWVNSDATVDWLPGAAPAVDPGVWAVDVDDARGVTIVAVDGEPVVVRPAGDWSGVAESDVLRLGTRPGRCCEALPDVAPSVPDRARVLASFAAAQRAAGSGVGSTVRALRWSGDLAGTPFDVVSVIAPSGAQVLTAHDVDSGRGWTTTMRALQPEALVFPFSPKGSQDVWTGLVGPTTAVRAEVVGPEGDARLVPLADGVGVVRGRPGADLDVSFLDPTGRTLSRARALPEGGGPVAAVEP